jgi:hypothetical protein
MELIEYAIKGNIMNIKEYNRRTKEHKRKW